MQLVVLEMPESDCLKLSRKCFRWLLRALGTDLQTPQHDSTPLRCSWSEKCTGWSKKNALEKLESAKSEAQKCFFSLHEHLKGVESCCGVCRFVPNALNNHLQHFSAQLKAVTLWPDYICEIIVFDKKHLFKGRIIVVVSADSCSTPTTTL